MFSEIISYINSRETEYTFRIWFKISTIFFTNNLFGQKYNSIYIFDRICAKGNRFQWIIIILRSARKCTVLENAPGDRSMPSFLSFAIHINLTLYSRQRDELTHLWLSESTIFRLDGYVSFLLACEPILVYIVFR